jgi:hypothetical protein
VVRPSTLRKVFQEVSTIPAVGEALFQILETQRMIASGARLMLLPAGPHGRMLSTLLAADAASTAPSDPKRAAARPPSVPRVESAPDPSQ